MSKTILVVDDSSLIRMQVRRTLLEAGFVVEEAVDGQDAYEKLGAHIDVMVCDVNMPRMSGIELLQKLHDEGAWQQLPILMLTTEGQPDIIKLARTLGARAWMLKPFKANLLVAAIEQMAA